MGLQSLYDVLKEKETELQELQRLLSEAQAVLNRVLELNAAANGSRPLRPESATANDGRAKSEPAAGPWQAASSTEFP